MGREALTSNSSEQVSLALDIVIDLSLITQDTSGAS